MIDFDLLQKMTDKALADAQAATDRGYDALASDKIRRAKAELEDKKASAERKRQSDEFMTRRRRLQENEAKAAEKIQNRYRHKKETE